MGNSGGCIPQRVRATYRGGIFVPEAPCDLPEGAAVDLTVHGPILLPPEVTDPEERGRILATMIDRMQKNPIPPDAPPLNRESLHE
jgi:predicted DNA-binding antitoxin AbrB/MazE fold protein